MAQSNVYSLNVVGYVNITVVPGYNLISLPLQNADPTSSINSVLTNTSYNGSPLLAPNGVAVYTWAGTSFNPEVIAGGDGNWYDQTGSFLVTNPLPPGKGFFFSLPTQAQQIALGNSPIISNLTITVVGSVLTGTNSYPVKTGFDFYGNFEPIQGDLTTNGLPVVDNSQYYTFNGHAYSSVLYGLGTNDSALDLSGNPAPYPAFTDAGGDAIVVANPAVGQGFLYKYIGGTATTWVNVFTVH